MNHQDTRTPGVPLLGALVSLWFTAWFTGCSRTPPPAPPAPPALFREVTLDFTHNPGAVGQWYMTEIMGSGGALFDYDNDGDLDIYLVQSSGGPSRLLRNELAPSGQLRFTDVTAQSGAGHVGYGMGVAVGDYDNDGYLDLYITCFGPNALLHNNGDGTFTGVTRQAGVDDARWSTGATFVDYDRDGDLDLFVLNYVDFTIAGNKRCMAATGEPDYCTPRAYKPVPARLFRNDGGGHFTDVTLSSGIGAKSGPGLGVVAADLNSDG